MLFKESDSVYRASNPPRDLESLFERSRDFSLLSSSEASIESPSGMVVLSQQIDENGLCELTKGRVEQAVKLMKQDDFLTDYLVMAGRDMHTGDDLPLAVEMWKHAFELGYPTEDRDGEPNLRFGVEDKATETFLQLFRFIRDFAIPRGWKSVGVCTSDYQLAKAAPFAEFIVGDDLDLWYVMRDTSDVFTTLEAHQEVFDKQFNYSDLAIAMYQEVSSGFESHGEMLRRMFDQHLRYQGKDPGKFVTNLPEPIFAQ